MAPPASSSSSSIYWDKCSPPNSTPHPFPPQISTRSGIVFAIGWMLSTRRHLAPYTRLYKSLGWDCLVCHPRTLNLFFPRWATALAVVALTELSQELERYPCPVVFAVFSGGHKTCLYKMIQIMLGKCTDVNFDECKLDAINKSVVGLIFDSSPVDFVSDIGAKVVSHQALAPKNGEPIKAITYGSRIIGKSLDAVFSKQFKQQRVELWHALYSSVRIGPILILCSENDELAPFKTIVMFVSNLQKLGGYVSMVSWKQSEHVGHFRHYPEEYTAEVRKLLTCAASTYLRRMSFDSNDPPPIAWTDLPKDITVKVDHLAKLPHDGKISNNNLDGRSRL